MAQILLGYTNLFNIQVSTPAGPSRNDPLMSFAVIRWDGSQSNEAAFEEMCQLTELKLTDNITVMVPICGPF